MRAPAPNSFWRNSETGDIVVVVCVASDEEGTDYVVYRRQGWSSTKIILLSEWERAIYQQCQKCRPQPTPRYSPATATNKVKPKTNPRV